MTPGRRTGGDHDHRKKDATDALVDARNPKGAHAHHDEIEKRECAKEDVTDTSGDSVHLFLLVTAVLGLPNATNEPRASAR